MKEHPHRPAPQATDTAETALVEQLRALRRASEQPLDTLTQARLAAARARAVDSVRPRAGVGALRWWWALRGATAAAAAALVLMMQSPQIQHHPAAIGTATTQADALEWVSDDGDMLAVVEDLDFYQWLSETDGAT